MNGTSSSFDLDEAPRLSGETRIVTSEDGKIIIINYYNRPCGFDGLNKEILGKIYSNHWYVTI